MKRQIYFKNLDGLRFLSFLSVFFFHSFYTTISDIKNSSFYHFVKIDLFGNGNIGVNFFFVLSGFLITYLLVEEKKINGQIKLKKFWIRRILRIWPLFYFCLLLGFVLFPWLKELFGQVSTETASPVFYLTFLNNFDFIKNPPDSSVLSVLWSIAVEEQFYLIWPLIIFFIPLKKLWIPFLLVILISLIYRAIYDLPILHEYHTLSCISDMAVGGMGAWFMHTSINFKNRIIRLPKIFLLVIYIVFIVVFFYRDELLYCNATIRIFERVFISLVILLIILEQSFSEKSIFKISRIRIISNLGNISYGLYCFQFIGILSAITITKMFLINNRVWVVFILEPIIALGITILISKLSYKYFEKPFLKLKEKFSFITK